MEDKKAKIWNERNRGEGEPYKKFILDSLILELARPLSGKIILEQGCGNGHLAKKIAQENPEKMILLDFFQSNLEFSKENLKDNAGHFEYVQSDLNEKLDLPANSIDLVIASMVLTEIENLENAVGETWRILKPNGIYIFTIIHPCYCFKKYLIEKISGVNDKKITPTRSYFEKGKSDFILGLETHEIIKAPHYNRTIQEYIDALLASKFTIEKMAEPQITPELLREADRFNRDLDCPIALIIKAKK